MAVSLDGLTGNLYNENNIKNQSASKLQDTLSGNLSEAEDQKLMDDCREFEAYFTEQVFKSMAKMVPESNDDSSSYAAALTDYYKESMLQELATESSKGQGLGLAQQLYEAMKRNYNIEK